MVIAATTLHLHINPIDVRDVSNKTHKEALQSAISDQMYAEHHDLLQAQVVNF